MRKLILALALALGAILPAQAQQSITVKNATVTSISGVAANCVHADTNGKLSGTGSDCGAGGGGGALVKIETETGAGVASIDLVSCFSSTYDTYFIDAQIVPASTQDLWMRVNVGGFDTGAHYDWAITPNQNFANGAMTGNGSGTLLDGKFILAGGVDSSKQANFTGYVWNSQSTTLNASYQFNGTYVDGGKPTTMGAFGLYTPTGAAVTQIRFLMASGNISGTIRCYGLAK